MASTLYYFPIRGRGETVRLAFALKGLTLTEAAPGDFKSNATDYPFAQAPR